MCFYGVGKNTSRDTKSLVGGGGPVFCCYFWDTPSLAQQSGANIYIIYVGGDSIPVLQLGGGGNLWARGQGKVRWDVWAGPGCVLCAVGHEGT